MASEFFVCFLMGEQKDIENSTAWGTTECPMACQDIASITSLCREDCWGHGSVGISSLSPHVGFVISPLQFMFAFQCKLGF